MKKVPEISYVEGKEVAVWKCESYIFLKTETKFSNPVEMADESALDLACILFSLLTHPIRVIIDDDHYKKLFLIERPVTPLPYVKKGEKISGVGGSILAWNDDSCILLETESASNDPIRLTDHQAMKLANILISLTRPQRILVVEGDHYKIDYRNAIRSSMME